MYLVFHYNDQCVSYLLESCSDLPQLGLGNLTIGDPDGTT